MSDNPMKLRQTWQEAEDRCLAALLPENTDGLQDTSEMMKYLFFYKNHSVWRASDLNGLQVISELEELPTFCVFHQNDNWYTPIETDDVLMTPDHKNPFFRFPPTRKFLYNQMFIEPAATDIVTPDLDKVIWRTIGYKNKIQEHRTKYMNFIRPVDEFNKLPLRVDAQSIACYNSLYRVRLMGLIRGARRFNFVMAQMLNNMAQMTDRHHYVQIPLSMMEFHKSDFMRTFKTFNRVTIKYPDSPHYVFMMHLLSFLDCDHRETSESMFNNIPVNWLDKVHFILTAGKKCVIYNLDSLKKLNGERNAIFLKLIYQINTLAMNSNTEMVVTPEPSIPDTSTTNAETPSETPADDGGNQPSGGLVIHHQPTQSERLKKEAETEIHQDLDFDTPMIPDELVEVDRQKETPNAPEVTSNALPISKVERKKEIKRLDQKAIQKIESEPDLTQAQKNRALRLTEAYKEIKLDGESIPEILEQGEVEVLPEEDLDFMKNEVPDASMLKSSVTQFDKTYMKKTFKRDLAATLVSFNAQGMCLIDVKKERVVTELNHMDNYVAKYEDTNHKTHTIRFTLPVVDDDGYCLVNGVKKMLKKQRVVNPICKVSDSQVTLNTNFNKVILVRNTNVSNSFIDKLMSFLNKHQDKVSMEYGVAVLPNRPLAYEYSMISTQLLALKIGTHMFHFNYEHRFSSMSDSMRKTCTELEKKYGVWFGSTPDERSGYFQDVDCTIYHVDYKTKQSEYVGAFMDLAATLLNDTPTMLNEFVDIKILNKKLPLAFILAYRFGLKKMLRYTNTNYRIYENGERFQRMPSDQVIKFADKTVVIPRTPLFNSLIWAGLNEFKLNDVLFEMMDEKDIYHELITTKKMTAGMIRGIDDFFDLFIDPISQDILKQMGKPTNVRDLLLYATSLITTRDHNESSSSKNHRIRSYERMVGIVYKEMARAFANYRNRGVGSTNTFSISEYAIKQTITDDKLMMNVDILNPIADIKATTAFSHLGSGGRSAETFMIDDRRFTKDDLGIISEATVDNGDTGLNSSLTMNPAFVNDRGITTSVDLNEVKPSQLLSVTGLLFPGVTSNDKRLSKIFNHLSGRVVIYGCIPSN